jgi:hypothetical protein
MRRIALLLPIGLLLAGCPGTTRKPMDRMEPVAVRIAIPDDPVLAERLEVSWAGAAGILWVPQGDATADVALVYGVSEPPAGMSATRIPAWDRTWYLEVDTLARWVNDPTFRRWLAARIDREGMARVLFGDGAEPVPSDLPEPGQRPVSAGARPRLQVVREAGSRTAERIVSRLRADLLPDRVLVETAEPNQDRAIALYLRDYDPKHEGTETDTVIPLIRERAYLLVRTGLTGIAVGPDGTLSLENPRWTP